MSIEILRLEQVICSQLLCNWLQLHQRRRGVSNSELRVDLQLNEKVQYQRQSDCIIA